MSISSVMLLVIELVIRQDCSAFFSKSRARVESVVAGIANETFKRISVNLSVFSTLSRTPSTSQFNWLHSSLEALAMALKERMKQLATAPVSNVSGDQRSPGPPNSAGAAVSSDARFGLVSVTLLPEAVTALTW